jgi:hypothetical protein
MDQVYTHAPLNVRRDGLDKMPAGAYIGRAISAQSKLLACPAVSPGYKRCNGSSSAPALLEPFSNQAMLPAGIDLRMGAPRALLCRLLFRYSVYCSPTRRSQPGLCPGKRVRPCVNRKSPKL